MTSPVAPVRHSLQQSRLPRDAERETAFLSFGPSFLSSLCIIVMPHGSRLGYYLSRFCTRLRRSLVTSCVSPEHCIRIASTAHLLSTVFISPFFQMFAFVLVLRKKPDRVLQNFPVSGTFILYAWRRASPCCCCTPVLYVPVLYQLGSQLVGKGKQTWARPAGRRDT